jgi:1,4-dihydroxy-2-naphthoyl-CoA hydrolase
MIWKTKPSLDVVNSFSKNTAVESLGIVYEEIGDDYLVARMPVDNRTVQPFRILHGGASVLLAETLGSTASTLSIDLTKYQPVGVEINANHLSSAREGTSVLGTVRPIRVGRTIHVWNIEIKDEVGKMICISRITIAVVQRS